MNYSKKMLLKYLEVCKKYFNSKGIDFPSDYPDFVTFIDEADTKFLLTPFGKQNLQWETDEVRLQLEFIWSFLIENITHGNDSEDELFVPQKRKYGVQHKVNRYVRITDTYSQKIDSYLDPGDADENYVYAIEVNDWLQVYEGDITDTDEGATGSDSEFYDIYEL
jgi:disulfide oxidoreductase YuzD